jgi:hypothetical protein
MEYFIGSIATAVVVLIAYKVFQNTEGTKPIQIKYTQSAVYELIKPGLDFMEMTIETTLITQATKDRDKDLVKIVMVDNEAYWIEDNNFYVGQMTEDGIDGDSVKTVDTMGMTDVELDRIMFIVEKLNEGKNNDSRSSGNSQL